MRVATPVLFSTIAACPLALFTLNATGDSRVPTQPESSPVEFETNTSSSNQPAIANQTTRISPPESFTAEPSTLHNQTVGTAAAPAGQLSFSPEALPRSTSIHAFNPMALSQAVAFPSMQRSIGTPERLDLPWNRIVARSVGLDERTAANASRVATRRAAPQPSPQAIAPPTLLPTPATAPPVEALQPVSSANASRVATRRAAPQPSPQAIAPPTLLPAPATAPPVEALQPVSSAEEPASQNAIDRSLIPVTIAQAQPLPAAALDQAYRLGAGDTIQVNFFNVPEYSGSQRILVDGTINMPVVGVVSVNGMTLTEAEQAIAQRYRGELSNIRVTVSLTQVRPLRVGVAGEVRQPGYYVMPSNDTQSASVAQAIQIAGGATQIADLRQIQVRRIGQNGIPQMISVNLWALLEEGDLSQNVTLRDGDTVMIAPTTDMNVAQTEQLAASNLASNTAQSISVSLVGEVGRPGAYRLDSAAGNRATLTQAIQLAGGVRPEANLRRVEVQRTARNGSTQTTTLDLWQLVTIGDLSQDLILQAGDRITVAKAEAMSAEEMAQVTGSNVSPSSIRVGIVGEVTSPGSTEVPANTTLNQVLLNAGGFNRRARHTVQLLRISPNGSVMQRRIEVDFERGLDSENNPILFNNDVIIVGRNGLARIGDSASNILEPIFRILPFFTLFQSF